MIEKDKGALVSARGQLERWRREYGGRGVRIPEKLWGEAVGLARVHGLAMTAQKLGLDRGRLEARVSLAEGQERAADRSEPVFVELGVAPLDGRGRTVVELVSRAGDRMRIDVTGGVDVVGLSLSFWSRQP